MRMNEGQLSEQLFRRWVNLCEQTWISLSERHRQTTSRAVEIFLVETTMGIPTLPLALPQVKPPTRPTGPAASPKPRNIDKPFIRPIASLARDLPPLPPF
jgi:hypothetical protein